MEAFKPKRSLFVHCCSNCEFSKKLGVKGTALDYICMKDLKEANKIRHLPGAHKCDVEEDGEGRQISWFDELKEEE